jgi:hypothetical protein
MHAARWALVGLLLEAGCDKGTTALRGEAGAADASSVADSTSDGSRQADAGASGDASGVQDQGNAADSAPPDAALRLDGGDLDPQDPDAGCSCHAVSACCDGCRTLVGQRCDDGLGCTEADSCDANGSCVGQPTCEAQNPAPECRETVCAEGSGCSFPAWHEGFACTPPPGQLNGRCSAGVCIGEPCPCSPAGPCCDGCRPTNDGGDCDDGDARTFDDRCRQGRCSGRPCECAEGECCDGCRLRHGDPCGPSDSHAECGDAGQCHSRVIRAGFSCRRLCSGISQECNSDEWQCERWSDIPCEPGWVCSIEVVNDQEINRCVEPVDCR